MENLNKQSEEEKRRFLREEVGTNVFVEAGAGAGKTRTIVERIVNQLENTSLMPEHVVVITFTNAAVNELYERIQKELQDRLEKTKVRGKLEAAFQNMDSMHISTIHSFCLDMLKERCFDAEMSLETELLDEEEAIQQKKDFFGKYYNENYPGKELSSVFPYGAYAGLESSFLEMADLRDTLFMYEKDKLTRTATGYQEKARVLLEGLWNRIAEILCGANQLNTDWLMADSKRCFEEYSGNCTRETGDFCVTLEKTVKLSAEKIVKSTWLGRKKADKEKAKPFLERIQEYWEIKQEELEGFSEDYELYRHALCMQYLEKAQKQYAAERAGSRLSNDELLYRARELVVRKQEAREFFQKKYRCFYVDEFQDTDPMQTEIILQLASEEGRLRDGALFIVGDPKQSIYGFRGADISLYRRVKQLFLEAENAEVIEISHNYRTDESVVAWVNAQFGKVIRDYRNMTALPNRTAKQAETGILLRGVYREEKETDSLYTADEDAGYLLRLIGELTHGDYLVYDKKQCKARRIEYRDILVLTGNTTDMQVYMKYFHRRGIPVSLLGKYTPKGREVLRRYLIVMEYLADPFDTMKKAAFQEQIAGNDLTRISRADFMEERKLAAFAQRCRSLHPMAAARLAASHRELYYPLQVLASISDSLEADICKMLERLTEDSWGNLADLVNRMQEYLEKDQKKELILEPRANAVRFMNIHQSKGQVWKAYIPVSIGNYKTVSPYPLCKKQEREEIKEREMEEFIRCEYVEATRAEEALILLPQMEGNNQRGVIPFEKYEASVQAHIPLPPEAEDEQADVLCKKEAGFFDSEERDLSRQLCPVYRKMSPSLAEHCKLQKEIENLEENMAEDMAEVVLTEEAEDRPKGNLFGTVMHRCFELVVNGRESIWQKQNAQETEGMLQHVIRFAMAENAGVLDESEQKKYRKYLLEVMKAFCDDKDITAYLKEAKQVYTELPFSYTEMDEEGEVLLHNGVMDLVIQNADDSWIIIDYKSNYRGQRPLGEFLRELNKKYEAQLAQYKKALAKIAGAATEVIGAGLYYL